MRNRRVSDHLGWLAVALAVASVAYADDPQKWLVRMNQALTHGNYDGVFSHVQAGRVETLRIIHRVQGDTVTERLVSLDGSGREFIRTGSELACYLPDQHTVVVEQRPAASLLLGSLPTFSAMSSDFYQISSLKRTRVLGRNAQLIAVTPKDEYRYGYRLWIDESTAMPLKTQLCDGQGQVIEQVSFASLKTPTHIPDSAFKPDLSTEGFRWLRNETSSAQSLRAPVMWSALKLPPGFRLSARAAQTLPGSNDPFAHLVFTDGLASVSVFVGSQARPDPQHVISGSTQVGPSSAFFTVIEGHEVTGVGEVPPQTVRFIVNSVTEQTVPPALSPGALSPSSLPAAH
ncbi:MAG TPA: MucB/RseB C-terminal domain-containing protein [Steroidobacteraceae bacterium]|jgi:sigma-E factor negative regulatory protein RseB|nr:MucB/RseB C-terminal domain-containing protein [Steroidobacteraceae bacterium]